MLNPKQDLTSFSRIYQAKSASSRIELAYGGGLAAEFAKEDTVHESDAAALSRLPQTQSISTIEELAALARLDRTQGTKFIQDLGLPSDLANRVIDSVGQVSPETLADMERFENLEYALGCDLDFSSPPPTIDPFQPTVVGGVTFGARPPTSQPPPTVVNLIDSHMPPIRDQGERPTCVAFTSVACLEYHLSRFAKLARLDLSEQFQYSNMVTKSPQRNLVSAYPLLASNGCCREISWPYYPRAIAGKDAQGPCPTTAVAEAMAYRSKEVRRIAARNISAIQAELAGGRIVGIGIPVYRSWFNNGTVRQVGNIILPIAGEVPEQIGHAIALVGYADDPDYAGGGYFIVRNSWGSYWATKSVFGPGYGTIPYRFISDYNFDAWCIVS